MIQLGKELVREEFSHNYVTVLNGVIGLTPKELEVLSYMLNKYYEAKERGDKPNILETEARKILVKETGIQNANLNKYLNIYLDKKLVYKLEDGTIEFNSAVFPPNRTTTHLQFSLFIKEERQ